MAEKKIIDGERRILTGISPKAWEHPADRAALNALRAVPGFDQVIKFIIGLAGEKRLWLYFMGGAVRCSETQYPKVHAMLGEATRILDSDYVPDIFVTNAPVLNAFAVGVDKPFIVINSDLARHFSEDELLGVIAHEMGHILSGHSLYKTMEYILRQLLLTAGAGILQMLPFSRAVLLAVSIALLEWSRKSELSCDRAALLVLQKPEVQYGKLMKFAGGVESEQMNIDDFMTQADEYESHGNLIDGVYKLLNLLGQTHPFPVLRVKELKNWVDDGKYAEILADNYLRRDSDEGYNFKGDFEQAYRQYKDDLKRSQDPLAKTLNNLGENLQEGVEKAAKQAEEFFSNLFK